MQEIDALCPSMIARIMRALTSIGIFEERGEGIYAHSTLSQTLTDRNFRTMISSMYVTPVLECRERISLVVALVLIKCRSTEAALGMSKLPEYLASIEYYNPEDQRLSLHQFACNTELGFSGWLRTQPRTQRNLFHSYLTIRKKKEAPIIREILNALFREPDPACASSAPKEKLEDTQYSLVAINPSHVQELEKLAATLKGRVVVQNASPGMNGRYRGSCMEFMTVNLFESQRINGAGSPV